MPGLWFGGFVISMLLKFCRQPGTERIALYPIPAALANAACQRAVLRSYLDIFISKTDALKMRWTGGDTANVIAGLRNCHPIASANGAIPLLEYSKLYWTNAFDSTPAERQDGAAEVRGLPYRDYEVVYSRSRRGVAFADEEGPVFRDRLSGIERGCWK
jgi:hypothetical protein